MLAQADSASTISITDDDFLDDALYALSEELVATEEMVSEEIEENGKSGSGRLILWLIIFSLAGLIVPLFVTAISMEEANLQLQDELEVLEARLSTTHEPGAQVVALQEERDALVSAEGTLVTQLEDMQTGWINWVDVMLALIDHDPFRLNLQTLTQNTRRLTITGRAVDEAHIIAYRDRLTNSGQFSRVTVQSINLISQQGAEPGNLQSYAEFTLLLEVNP